MAEGGREVVQIAVVGAGVVGTSVASLLSERLGSSSSVTLIADKFSPQTTSDKSGALTVPFELSGGGADLDPREKGWLARTMHWLGVVYNSSECRDSGVTLVHGCMSLAGSVDLPWWKDYMLGFSEVDEREKRLYNIPREYKHVYSFSSYVVECSIYLLWLLNRFKCNGGTVQCRHISTLDELSSFNVIVNCTGLGSRQLVSDQSIYPTRGDAVTVRAPWVKQFIFLINKEQYTYVFPRSSSVLCGGTGIDHDWSDVPDPLVTENILKRCAEVVPSLADAEVIDQYAGLRPMRTRVRLEAVPHDQQTVIHCYGHGGKGITYSWGCADDVCKIIEETSSIQRHDRVCSKL